MHSLLHSLYQKLSQAHGTWPHKLRTAQMAWKSRPLCLFLMTREGKSEKLTFVFVDSYERVHICLLLSASAGRGTLMWNCKRFQNGNRFVHSVRVCESAQRVGEAPLLGPTAVPDALLLYPFHHLYWSQRSIPLIHFPWQSYSVTFKRIYTI